MYVPARVVEVSLIYTNGAFRKYQDLFVRKIKEYRRPVINMYSPSVVFFNLAVSRFRLSLGSQGDHILPYSGKLKIIRPILSWQ